MPGKDPVLDIDFEEDILELTDIVTPSASVKKNSAGMDFGADLDSLLADIGIDSGAVKQKIGVAPASNLGVNGRSPYPADAAYPGNQPVNPPVNPNEELDMPGLSDLDSLLAQLGAAPEKPAVQPAPKIPPTPLADDLDAMPAQKTAPAQAAKPAHAEMYDPQEEANLDISGMLASLLTEDDASAPMPGSAVQGIMPETQMQPLPEIQAAPLPEPDAPVISLTPAPQPAPVAQPAQTVVITQAPQAPVHPTAAEQAQAAPAPEIEVAPAPQSAAPVVPQAVPPAATPSAAPVITIEAPQAKTQPATPSAAQPATPAAVELTVPGNNEPGPVITITAPAPEAPQKVQTMKPVSININAEDIVVEECPADINALDNIIDSVLAAAPASGPAPKSRSGAEGGPDFDLASLLKQFASLRMDMTQTREESVKLATELEKLRAENEAKNAELEKFQAENAKQAAEIADLARELNDFRTTFNNIQAKVHLENLPDHLNSLTGNTERLQSSISASRKEQSQMLKDIGAMRQELSNLKGQSGASTNTIEQINSLFSICTTLDNKLEQQTGSVNQLKKDLAGISADMEKQVSAAAAKVLREEIANLASALG